MVLFIVENNNKTIKKYKFAQNNEQFQISSE